MGQRHVRGVVAADGEAFTVDPRPDTGASFTTLEEALAAGGYDGAILAETAGGRLERFRQIVDAGIGRVLAEKPLEQSRGRVHAFAELASTRGVETSVNHYFRTLDFFRALRQDGARFQLAVTGGAFGLACNGIHWIDLALFLSGDAGGALLHGELEPEPIASGRGPAFRDYGGRVLYGLGDGSRLFLASSAGSSAPMHVVLEQPARQVVLFPGEELALRYVRRAGIDLPAYRYGAGYERHEDPALAADDAWRSTESWLRGEGGHPDVRTSLRAHDLLFDLLETSGEHEFAIT